ncbi:hypothetical protein C8Q80DRAFT_1154511 [Daedaleopsis nitida]|nr:hypothetical protein C8Q80DRAFT_1154511 [Daedaleopsis nitida]
MVSFFPQPCPQLPDFQQLLVRGSFHASAPIHLLFSYTSENTDSRAILLTPRRDSLKDVLVELNDQWINVHSGIGSSSAAAQRTELFYPPTLAHMKLLLSMLHEYDDTVHHAKTTLDIAPSLLVLHDISAYFIAQVSEAT